MDHFVMLAFHEQLVETVLHLHRSKNVLSKIYGTLCGPLEIKGGPR